MSCGYYKEVEYSLKHQLSIQQRNCSRVDTLAEGDTENGNSVVTFMNKF